MFAVANQFPLERVLTRWDGRSRDENEHFEVFKAFEFITSTSNPVLFLQRGHGFRPGRIVTSIKGRYNITV